MYVIASDEPEQGEKKEVPSADRPLAGSCSLEQCDTMGPGTQAGDSSRRQEDVYTQLLLSNRHTQLCRQGCLQRAEKEAQRQTAMPVSDSTSMTGSHFRHNFSMKQ